MSGESRVEWLSRCVTIRRMFWSGMRKRRVGFELTDVWCYVGGRTRELMWRDDADES